MLCWCDNLFKASKCNFPRPDIPYLAKLFPMERKGKGRGGREAGKHLSEVCDAQGVLSGVKGNISTLLLHPLPVCSQAEPGSCCMLSAWRPVRSTQDPGPRLNKGDAEGTCISCQSRSVATVAKAVVGQPESDTSYILQKGVKYPFLLPFFLMFPS